MDSITAHALIRFGLGRHSAEPEPPDPLAWLQRQVRESDPALFPGLPTTAQALAVYRDYIAAHRADPAVRPEGVRALFEADANAHLAYAIGTNAPYRERLVWFWSNHFTVARRKIDLFGMAGPFVREAIRPHATGRFADLLIAVMRHPAMLDYLDNAGSVGPHSRVGGLHNRGLNENLARECLELYTAGVDTGYTQTDVIEFAKILTGWSVERQVEPLGFRFRPNAHEPGPKTLMGRVFPPGEEGGVQALEFLATHPATHRHLAAKLAAHFIADDPPPASVRRIEGVLRDTQGDLGAAALALVTLGSAWQPLAKLRTPQEYSVACVRALAWPQDRLPNMVAVLAALGQPLWRAPLPNGWSDRAADWADSDALLRRVDWVYRLAEQVPDADAAVIGEACLGPLLRVETRRAMQHAGSRRDALTLLLASPEFMRR